MTKKILNNFDWTFFKKSLKILIPIILSQVVIVAISFVDGIMVNGYERVGQPPKVDYAAIGIANEIWFAFQAFFFATSIVFGILYAQFAHNQKIFTDIAKFNFWYSILITTFISLVMFLAADQLVNIFFISNTSHDSQIIKQIAINYLKIIALGHIFISLAWALLNPLIIKGKAKYALYISLVSLALNIIFDYILIYKLDLGAEGAAWATVIGYAIELSIALLFIWVHKNWFSGFFSTNIFRQNTFVIKEIFKRSFIFFAFVFMQMGLAATTTIYVNLYSTDIIKPMSVAYTVSGLLFAIFAGINRSVKIFVGPLLGMEKYKEAREIAPKLFFTNLTLTFVFVILSLISTLFFPRLMLDSDYDIEVAKTMIYTFSGAMMAYIVMQYFSSILETSGYQMVPNILNYFFHVWAVIPMIFILSHFGFGFPFKWNFIISQSICFIPALIIYINYKKYKWLRRIEEY